MTTKDGGEGVTITRSLARASLDNGTITPRDMKVKALSRKDVSLRVGRKKLTHARVCDLFLDKSPTLSETILLAGTMHLSVEEMIDRDAPSFPFQRNGIAWRLAGVPRGTSARACRIAISRVLAGDDVDTIRAAVKVVFAAKERRAPLLSEPKLRDMAHGGLAMGLVRFETPLDGDASAVEDRKLAARLQRALEREPLADGSKPRRRPVVRVVKNVAHESFAGDPVAPFLIARVAHEIVALHMLEHSTVYAIGLAGGMHCATFVGTTGPESSPFPDDSGDKQITFVPLTLEPFANHELPMADVVVGQMVAEARCLLGTRRVGGLALQSFGYVVDGRVDRLDNDVLTIVRQRYRDLDVAIYGCGDLEGDGWLAQVMHRVRKVAGPIAPVADVCLNLLAEDGSSILLPDGREFVGIGLADIQRLVGSSDRLALLLTSGKVKGRSIVAATRAGCVGTIVCDQAAAQAALAVLNPSSS